MQVTDQPPRPVTPAPTALYPECDCGQEATTGHVCRPPQPVPSPKALAALHRLETWAAHVLRDAEVTA